MKRIITILATCLFAFASINSQAQAIDEGDVIIDVYYGYVGPGLILGTIDALAEGTNAAGTSFNPQTSVSGPIGLRMQYMVSPSFGVGVDLSFERKAASWTGGIFDTTGTIVEVDGEYQVTKIKAMVRTSWEFVNTDKFTMNWANSIGYKAGNRIFEDESGEAGVDLSGRVFPIALRSAVGMRFFFTENIAAHAEIGAFGGGTILGGISLKL